MTGALGQRIVTAGAVGFTLFVMVIVSAGTGVFMFMFMCVIVTASAGVIVFMCVVVTAGTGMIVFVFSHFLLPFLSFFGFGFGLILGFGVQLDPDLPFFVA